VACSGQRLAKLEPGFGQHTLWATRAQAAKLSGLGFSLNPKLSAHGRKSRESALASVLLSRDVVASIPAEPVVDVSSATYRASSPHHLTHPLTPKPHTLQP
jgi:hypothetical protein